MRQKLLIDTTDDMFYRQYVEVVKVFPPINKLNRRELGTLSEIMRKNNELSKKFKDCPEDEDKWTLLMSRQIRKEMRERAGLSIASWNNNLNSLRSAGILIDNKLTESLRVYPTKKNVVSFEFYIKIPVLQKDRKGNEGVNGSSEHIINELQKV